jgi:hypothetical protein
MADHRRFSIDSRVAVYFCDPRSPCQRGSNEDANGLLRQYFPRARASPGSLESGSTRSRRSSTGDRARRSDGRPPAERLTELVDGLDEAAPER